MFLDPFFTADADVIRITAAQGSAFAKDIAGDFNPIHDADNLEVSAEGPTTRDAALIESLVRRYVAFSGRNFPHILVPLMERQGVMINTDRPQGERIPL